MAYISVHTHAHTNKQTLTRLCRLADKTEQHEVVREKLHHNERLLAEMQGERSKTSREGSSRLANLNQALMKVIVAWSRWKK